MTNMYVPYIKILIGMYFRAMEGDTKFSGLIYQELRLTCSYSCSFPFI